jgi:hypothetical protein
MSIKKIIAIGGAVVLVGVSAIGASLVQAQATPTPVPTQTQPTPAPTQAQPQQRQALQDRYLQALASRLNVSVDQLRQAMQAARQEVGIPDKPARGLDGRGFGFGGRGAIHGLLGQQMQSLATLFNISQDQLRQELPGKTLAEVAQAHGKPAQDVINTIVTTANQQIDQMAQQRNLSPERVAQLKQQVSQSVPDFVNNHRFGTPRTRTSS